MAKAGDVRAFEFLVSRHRAKAFRIILKITKNREDAEDQFQETFLRAYLGLHEFRGNSRFSSWLMAIAVNQALGCLRKRRYDRVSLDHPFTADGEFFEYEVPERRPNPEQTYVCSENAKNLRVALSRLPKAFRSVLVLRHVHEYSTEETAIELGISVAAVKSRLLRARKRLWNRIGYRPTS